MRRSIALSLLGSLATLWGLASEGQAQAPAPLTFDVASIKLNKSGSTRSSTSMPPVGRFEAVNVTLRELVVQAFQLRPFQVVGGPGWLDGDHFDVLARTPDGALPDRMPEMLRALLTERFQLEVHTEMREQPVYALVAARSDGRLGPGLRRADCSGDTCGMETSTSNGSGSVKGVGRTMSDLTGWLSRIVDRAVMDHTGMPGTYDFELRFTRDEVVSRSTAQPSDPPSIFTALQEQLGLKLEGARGPVEFLVIDAVEAPTPN